MEAHLLQLPLSCPVRAEDVPDADVVIITWWDTTVMVPLFPASKGRKIYSIQHQ